MGKTSTKKNTSGSGGEKRFYGNSDGAPKGELNAWDKLGNFAEWAIYDIPPGPHILPMRYYANAQKFTSFFLMFFLMCYYDSFSTGRLAYLFIHGTYGKSFLY